MSQKPVRKGRPSKANLAQMALERPYVERARVGDRAAFTWLIQRNREKAQCVVTAIIGNWQLADDAVQVASLACWRVMARFRADCTFSTWLIGSAKRAGFKIKQGQKRYVPNAAMEDRIPDPIRPDWLYLARERVDLYQAALATLDCSEKEVFDLRFEEELSNNMIATVTGRTAGEVTALLDSIQKKMSGTGEADPRADGWCQNEEVDLVSVASDLFDDFELDDGYAPTRRELAWPKDIHVRAGKDLAPSPKIEEDNVQDKQEGNEGERKEGEDGSEK